MRQEPIRAVALGCGRMGRLGIQLMHKKGIRIVGAVDTNPALQGQDVGEYAELGCKLGVTISDDLEGVLDSCKPDIVIAALFSFVDKCEPFFAPVLSRGINLLTTCDEAHYSWNTSPASTNRLDKLARDNGCTICGSGLLDVFWMQLPLLMASGMMQINRIEGTTTFNTDEYGPALAEAYNIGKTPAEFETLMSGASQPDGFLMRATNDAICARLGLTPTGHKVEMLPYIAPKEIYSTALGRTIPAGDLRGTQEVVTTTTQQGIEIVTSDIGYVYADGEGDVCTWKLSGLPDVEVSVPNLNSYIFTMGNLVNRIPDVIKAQPGFVTTSELDMAHYYAHPMELYL